jgi:hypothetical protein
MMRAVLTSNLVKALGRGTPLSPMIFNLEVDVFTQILNKVVAKGYITGFMDNLYHEGIIRL